MNNKFKGLYDTEKTTFITYKTEPINYYEPTIKTPRIQNHTYSINFDKTELYKEIDDLKQELQRKDNIINELKYGIKELDDMFYETFRISQKGYFSISEWKLKDFTDKIKELEESNENRKCS